jgi:hypothetical protein
MEPEKEVSFFKLIRELNWAKIRYVIIGRRAVILFSKLAKENFIIESNSFSASEDLFHPLVDKSVSAS